MAGVQGTHGYHGYDDFRLFQDKVYYCLFVFISVIIQLLLLSCIADINHLGPLWRFLPRL